MGLFSGGLVTVLTMIEGLKRTLAMTYTPMSRIMSRYPIAILISGLAPFLFYGMGFATNELVKVMGLLTQSSISGVDHFTSALQGVGEHVMEAVVMFVFLIVMCIYIFRVLLYHANRWFGLLFNMVTTPIAMTAFIFKPYQDMASSWFKDTMGKFLVVVVHSLFLGLIGVLLYAPTTQFIQDTMGTFQYVIVKLMFAIGGLQMMLKPPAWIVRGFDSGDSVNGTKRAFRPLMRLIGKANVTFPKGGGKS
jgi:hypothetical protein